MAKTVAELNAEIKKLEAARDEQIEKEKTEILKDLKSKIKEYKISILELFSSSEFSAAMKLVSEYQPAAQAERKERRTKEQIKADALAKLNNKLAIARDDFKNGVAVYRDGDKVFVEGQKGIRPSWMTDDNLVKTIDELN